MEVLEVETIQIKIYPFGQFTFLVSVIYNIIKFKKK